MNTRVPNISIAIAMLFIAGCASPSAVSQKCEVHNCAMSSQQIQEFSPGGYARYTPDFEAAQRTRFPHHGGGRLAEDRGYMYAQNVQVYVCPKCEEAHRQWMLAHAPSPDPKLMSLFR
jgi:hypothetical protein